MRRITIITTLAALAALLHGDCSIYRGHNPSPYNLRFVEDCVNAALRNDSGLNTSAYRVDMSKVPVIPGGTTNAFFLSHRTASRVVLDTLFKTDSLWIKYGYFDRAVIRFEKIEESSGRLHMIMSKYKAADGAIGLDVIFRKTTNGFLYVGAHITWMS